MRNLKERDDNDHHGDTKKFIIEKKEHKCIHLELSASPDVFQSPKSLRFAIKALLRQFVKAGELDKNVPATVNINITVKSALTKGIAIQLFILYIFLQFTKLNEDLSLI